MADEDFRPEMHGLVTDPSAILAGSGGFAECLNAVCKRDGLVETRGGFEHFVSDLMKTDVLHSCTYAREIGTSKWYVATDGTTSKVYEASNITAALTTAADTTHLRAELLQNRYAWTFPLAMRMLDQPGTFSSTSFARLQGAPRAGGVYAYYDAGSTFIAVGYTLPPNTGLAYRVVIARPVTTPTGRSLIFGAPTDRLVIWRRDAAGVLSSIPTLVVQTDTLAVGDIVQIYRTLTPSAWPTDPGDEMVLVQSYTIGTLAATYSWTDNYWAGEWSGPALYTNDTQESLINANYRVRLASDVAYYNGMAFYAQAKTGYTTDIALLSVLNGNVTGPVNFAKTLYTFPLVADSTNASAVLTNCNPTVTAMDAAGQLSVGQLVNLAANDPETAGTVYGRIVSWNTGANTVTLDTASTATAAANNLMVWDWLGMETSTGTRYLVYCMPYNATVATVYGAASGVFYIGTTANQYVMLHSTGGQDIERAFSARFGTAGAGGRVPRLYTASPAVHPYTNNVQIRCQWDDDASVPTDTDFTAGLFEFVSSKPFAFSSQVGTTYSANYVRAQMDGYPGRLAYSKLQQPESVPLLYYTDIGDRSLPIVRVVATTDRLWVFKADGLWCVMGDTPDSLQVQAVDPTLRMTFVPTSTGAVDPNYDTSEWVRKLGNTVYAWTTKGVFAVDASGPRRVDTPIATELRAWIPSLREGTTITKTWSGVDLQQGLVIFGCNAHTRQSAGFAYGLHVETGAWFTVDTTLRSFLGSGSYWTGSGDSDKDRLLLGAYDGYSTYRDPPDQYTASLVTGLPFAFSDALTGAGAVTAITITNVTGLVVTATGAEFIEGCLIQQGGAYYMTLPTTGTHTATVDRTGLVNGAATVVYYPITKTITYASTTEGMPAIEKFYVRSYFGFQRLRGGTFFKVRTRARDKGTPSAWQTCQYPVQATPTTLNNAIGLTADREYEAARAVATDMTRATGLAVTWTHSQAATYFAMDSMSLRSEARSDRTGGRT